MNRADLVESTFYPIRVTGKSWTAIPEIRNYITELIGSSSEKKISQNTSLYGNHDLNFNYPVTLSFSFSDKKYHLTKDLDVIVINEQQVINEFQRLLRPYKFKSIQASDIQVALYNMGVKGYLSHNNLVIMNPFEYLEKSDCGCHNHTRDEGW